MKMKMVMMMMTMILFLHSTYEKEQDCQQTGANPCKYIFEYNIFMYTFYILEIHFSVAICLRQNWPVLVFLFEKY